MTAEKILVAWIGDTDLRASKGLLKNPGETGPLAAALAAVPYTSVRLLTDYLTPPEAFAALEDAARREVKFHLGDVEQFVSWLAAPRGKAFERCIEVERVDLSQGPTHYAGIYEACDRVLKSYPKGADVTVHLSPGTPAMHAAWVLLTQSRFRSFRLIESSVKAGVQVVSIPFDISAEFVRAARAEDQEFLKLLQGGDRSKLAPKFRVIVHKSAAMSQAIAVSHRLAPYDFPVLIEGETGTGKELFAAAIHDGSPRARKELVAINCGAIPEKLIESELFGHEMGSFTGAHKQHIGFFEKADGGTLFLDEIGELAPALQTRLLRVLQEGTIRRVGGEADIKVDVRIVAATNRNLLTEVRNKTFRVDLYYRLALGYVRIPPLRQREGCLKVLVEHFMHSILEEDKKRTPSLLQRKHLAPEAVNRLLAHSWPGNVRELDFVLKRACLYTPGDRITAADIERCLLGDPTADPDSNIRDCSSTNEPESSALPSAAVKPAPPTGPVPTLPADARISLLAVEKNVRRFYLERSIKLHPDSLEAAAESVGANYVTYGRWLKAADLSHPRQRGAAR